MFVIQKVSHLFSYPRNMYLNFISKQHHLNSVFKICISTTVLEFLSTNDFQAKKIDLQTDALFKPLLLNQTFYEKEHLISH